MLYALTQSVRKHITCKLPGTVWGVLHCPDIESGENHHQQYELLIAVFRQKKPALSFARSTATEADFADHDSWQNCKVSHVSAGEEIGHGEYWAIHNLPRSSCRLPLVIRLRDWDWQVEHFRVRQMSNREVAQYILQGTRCLQSSL